MASADRIAPKKFMRGARPTPRAKLAAATPYHWIGAAPPAEFAFVPPHLRMWGNNQYGDCVSAEEAFAKVTYALMQSQPELLATDDEVVAWARKHGFLNGADLLSVIQAMQQDGMQIGTVPYKDGKPLAVDYSNETTLAAAIYEGPVKIAIDGDALPDAAGAHNGWWTIDETPRPNTDHCVGLCGKGSAAFLFNALGVQLPGQLAPTRPGYLLFTWSTIGFVTHGWLQATCVEAWLRRPTTPVPGPGPFPDPGPGPTPPPVPNWIEIICTLGPTYLNEPWATILRFICTMINRDKVRKALECNQCGETKP